MRMLFSLFIFLPLILSQSLEQGYAKKNDFLGFRGELHEKLKGFKSKTDDEKDKILKKLDSSISDLNKEIKDPVKRREIVDLMKNILEINQYMKYRDCNQEDENCRNEKKRLMNNLLAAFQDNFGKCEVTYKRAIDLTSNTHSNLVAFTSIIQSIADNKEFIEKSKINTIVDIIDCLKETKFNDIIDEIEKQYNHNPQIVPNIRDSQKKILENALSELKGSDGTNNLSLEPGYAKANNFLGLRAELLDKLKDFQSKTDDEKDKILKKLDGSITDLNEEIKDPVKRREIVELMKKILEINQYMGYRVCNQEDENCRNKKKRLMNNLLAAVQDNLGKCDVTYDRVTKLTDNTHSNLVALTLIIQSIIDNKEFIEKGETDIIVDIINCLKVTKFNDIMDKIADQYNGNTYIVPYLKDSQKKTLEDALSKLNGF